MAEEKAIFAIRSGVIDSVPWTPEKVLGYYGIALQKAGFSSYAMPIVQDFPVMFMVEESPDHVFKTLSISDTINDPPLLDLQITSDTRAPAANESLVDAAEIFVTTFVWSVCGPIDGIGFLRDLFRKTHPSTPGIRWFRPSTKFVALFDDLPETLPGYPNRPEFPQACIAQEETIPESSPEPYVPPREPERATVDVTPASLPIYEPVEYEPIAVIDTPAPVAVPKPAKKKHTGLALATLGTLITLGYQYGPKGFR